LPSAANHIEAGGEEALSIQRVLDYVVPAFERLLSRVKPVSSGLPQGDAVLAHEIQSLICLVFGALRRSQQGVLAPGHEQEELLRGPSPAATRSSQQRGSAGWLQSTPPASPSAPEELRRRCSMAVLRLQMLGPTQRRDPVSSIGGQPHQPRRRAGLLPHLNKACKSFFQVASPMADPCCCLECDLQHKLQSAIVCRVSHSPPEDW